MAGVLSVGNLVIATLIAAGCVVGSGIFGWLAGGYPVESAVTAGLCMANMGGAGDLAVPGELCADIFTDWRSDSVITWEHDIPVHSLGVKT